MFEINLNFNSVLNPVINKLTRITTDNLCLRISGASGKQLTTIFKLLQSGKVNIKKLYLEITNATSEGDLAQAIKGCSIVNLASLNLSNIHLGFYGISHLWECTFPNLTQLILKSSDELEVDDLSIITTIAQVYPNFKYLEITYSDQSIYDKLKELLPNCEMNSIEDIPVEVDVAENASPSLPMLPSVLSNKAPSVTEEEKKYY